MSEPVILSSVKCADTFGPIVVSLDRVPAAGAEVLAQLRDAVDALIYSWSTSAGTAVISGADIELAAVPPEVTRLWPPGIHGFELQLRSGGRTTTQIFREELAITVLGDGAYVS